MGEGCPPAAPRISRAQRQCRELDEREPNHLLSTRSAATRGNRSVFAALEGTADASVLMLEHTQQQELASLMRVAPARTD
jgi:hypothetical protein